MRPLQHYPGQCNASDRLIWKTKYEEARKALDDCGTQCWGAEECTSKCIIKKESFSKPCADCFGKFAVCGRNNCMFKCITDKQSPKCIKCMRTYCEKSFIDCSGLSSPLPPAFY